MPALPAKDLQRAMTFPQLLSLGFGAIVGVGWIIAVGQWIEAAGPCGSVLAFVAGAAVTALVGYCYAQMASRYPVIGGDALYAYNAFGKEAAYFVGWFLIFVYTGVVAFMAISFGWLLSVLAPQLQGPVLYHAFGEPVHLADVIAGLVGMGAIATLNIRGAHYVGSTQSGLIAWKIVLSLGFIALGICNGTARNLSPLFGSASGSRTQLGGILTVFSAAPFWYAGFGVITQAMAERSAVLSAERAARAIALSIGLACLYYCLVIVSVAMVAPRSQLLSGVLPAADAFRTAFDSTAISRVVLAVGLLGVLSTWNAVLFAAARILLSLARARMFPPALAAVHPAHATPHAAIATISLIAGAASLLGRAAVRPIVNTSGVVLAVLFVLVSSALIRQQRHERAAAAPGLVYRVVPRLALVGSSCIVLIAIRDMTGTRTAASTLEALALLVWLLAGSILWAVMRAWRSSMTENERRAALFGASGAPDQ